MSVRSQLCFAVVFLAAVETINGEVSFTNKNFKMTCPGYGKWFEGHNNNNNKEIGDGKTLELEYKDRRIYRCNYKDENDGNNKNYYFYVWGKVCDNCFELDGKIWAAIIVADMVLTMVVMAIVYKCTKRRSSAGLPQTPRAGPGGRVPPTPSPDYERLDPHTLSQGTYSEVHTNRTD